MAGGVASALLERRADAQLGLFEVDEFWLDGGRAGARAARDRARQPLPRPARPLRRARDDRRALGGAASRGAPAQLVLNADDPLIADLGRERAGTALLRHRGPARPRPAGPRARLRLDALPRLRRGLRLQRTSTSPTSASTPAPAAAASARSRRSARSDDRARRPARRELRAAHAARRDAPCAPRCRASTTSTTRSPPRRSRPRSGSRRSTIAAGLARRRARCSAAASASRSATASSRSC